MFDDYVEHANGPAAGLSRGTTSVGQLEYEGFEPSPYDAQDNRADGEELLSSLDGQGAVDPQAPPIFEIGEVQYAIPAALIHLAVSSDILAMGLANNLIILIELARPEQVIKLPIPKKPQEFTIYKLFLDPSGRHLIVTSTQGENWYLYRGWKKPKQLKTFRMVIESVAWNKAALLSASHSTSTREILVGGRNGTVYEALLDAEDDFFKSQERYLQPVYSVPDKQPITGVKFDFYPPTDSRKIIVVVTTPSRIFQFVGGHDRKTESNRLFLPLFMTYKDTLPKILDLPGNSQLSELHFFTPNADQASSLPTTMAWMTGSGIFHGSMNYASTSDDFIDGAQLLPYPTLKTPSRDTSGSMPISIGLTEFHFLLLYKNRLAAICNLNDELDFEQLLPLKAGEQVNGLAIDPVRKTYWIYTNLSLFELVTGDENRDVWSIYLSQGQHEVALQHAKTAPQRDRILSSQADAYFAATKYIQSAQCYAQCSASFEEVVLKFIDVGERFALRYYLIARLERTRKTDLTQRMMLATWLVELYLARCNELEDVIASESVSHDVENLRTEKMILEDDLRNFLETYKANLDPTTIYELIEGHGRTDMYLHFATVIGDNERVAEHWILEEEWLKAITVLNKQNNLDLYYRFGAVLIREAPKETVDAWLKQDLLDPLRLVPALLRTQDLPRTPGAIAQALRYLNHVVFAQNNVSPIIHNLLITFHVKSNAPNTPIDETPLLQFLTTAPADPLTDKPYYDLDYALRMCIQAELTQACVHIYSKMGLWENSVDLALQKGDIELAKINADMPEDDQPLRKKLWLKIAKYVVQDKQDIKSAMAFLENTDLLKIEDILPFFPDFVVIDDFKDEICLALEGYSTHIDTIKAEMDEELRSAELIKEDIQALRNRFVTIDSDERCSVCSQSLLTRQFYVFPCQHTFHTDCLIGLAKEYLSAASLRRILSLQQTLTGNTGRSLDRVSQIRSGAPMTPNSVQRNAERAPSSNSPATAGPKATRGAGWNLLSAGDKLRDLIIPESLATVVSAGVWSTGLDKVGIPWGGAKPQQGELDRRVEKAREELEDLLASTCPLCESVVAGLDKPFIREDEDDTSWQI